MLLNPSCHAGFVLRHRIPSKEMKKKMYNQSATKLYKKKPLKTAGQQ